MRKLMIVTLGMATLLGACQVSKNNAADNAADRDTAAAVPPAVPQTANAAGQPASATQPVLPPPLAEPKGPIDPTSAAAAGQVVQHYGALIEEGRWTESWKLWSDPDAAKRFDRNWRDDRDVHLEIGQLGEPEGAAGSIYISEPVTFYGKTKAGGSFRRGAEVVMRRVNDVPGSTAAQRRWHIERIEWK